MSGTYVVYGVFGDPRNGKGCTSYYSVKAGAQTGLYEHVLALNSAPVRVPGVMFHRVLPFGYMIPKLLFGAEVFLWKGIPSRQISVSLFDRIAANRLPKTSFVHVGTPTLRRVLKKGRQLGMTTIVQASTAAANFFDPVWRDECRKEGVPFKYGGIVPKIDDEFIELVDAVVTGVDFIRDTYVEAGFPENRIWIAKYGADTDSFCPGKPNRNGPFRCVFVGHMSLIKGAQYLLEAWKKLSLKDAELIVCGLVKADSRGVYARYKDTPGVIWAGNVRQVEKVLAKSNLFIFPSLVEGSSKAILEAKACGLPVLATSVSRECVEEGVDGFTVPPANSDALAERIEYCYHHREKCEEMGRIARERMIPRTWDAFSQEMKHIYADIL